MARVLLVDGDNGLRAVLRMRLERLGHVVDEASGREEAMKRFREKFPVLVITDLVLRDGEGLESIQALKRAAPHLRIIAMSGGGFGPAGTHLRLAEKMGASYGLAKPFSNEEFEIVVARLISETEEERQAGRESPPRFLVLDDDETSRYIHKQMIADEFPGCSVVECGSPDDALVESCAGRLDAVITDHHLGASTGAEFIANLRQCGTQCPIFMVTGSSDPKVHDRAYKAGACRVFGGGNSNFIAYLRTVVGGS